MKAQSINGQPAMLLASIDSTGAGALTSTRRQQGVRESVGTSGWAFTTDGTNGQLTLNHEATPPDTAGNGNLIMGLATNGAYHLSIVSSTTTQTVFLVQNAAASAAIDLTAVAVRLDVVGGIL